MFSCVSTTYKIFRVQGDIQKVDEFILVRVQFAPFSLFMGIGRQTELVVQTRSVETAAVRYRLLYVLIMTVFIPLSSRYLLSVCMDVQAGIYIHTYILLQLKIGFLLQRAWRMYST